jgi:hypothetical protein
MSTEEVELEGLEYFIKFKERLDIAMAYISDGRDITDDDYNVLREIHRIEREGRLPFYKTISLDNVTNVTQPDLFSANMSTT